MPTSKGQALADEYGIKFFETVSCMVAADLIFSFVMQLTIFFFFGYYENNGNLQSAKTNLNVEEVFFSIATDIKQRLTESDKKAEVFSLLWNFYFSLFTLINPSTATWSQNDGWLVFTVTAYWTQN